MKADRIAQMEKMLAESPEDAFIIYALGLEYQKRDVDKAKQFFEKNFLTNPEYLPNYYHFAHLLWEINDIPYAIKIFEEGILLATKVNDTHALGELKNAYMNFKIDTNE